MADYVGIINGGQHDRWSFSPPRVTGVIVAVGFLWIFIQPIIKRDLEIATRKAELADIENKLRGARLDSLNRVLLAKKSQLESQVEGITTRLDSTEKRKKLE